MASSDWSDSMKRLVFWLLPFLVPTPALGAETGDAKLTAFFRSYLEDEFRQRPLEATRLGDHRFDHRLDDISAKARAGWAERIRKALADLPKMVDFQKLSRSAQI